MNKHMLLIGGAIAVAIAVGLAIFLSTPQREGDYRSLAVGAHTYRVEIADTLATQARGLSGRESLAPGEGMLFVFSDSSPRTFWMYEMRFPIDIIWINDHKVIGWADNAPISASSVMPATFSSPFAADMVLELPAGTVARDGIMVGSAVELK